MAEEKVLRLITNPNLLKTHGKYNLYKLFKLIDYVNKHEHLYEVFCEHICPGRDIYGKNKKMFLDLVDDDLINHHIGKLSEYEYLESIIYYSICNYFSDLFYYKIPKTDMQLDFTMKFLTNIKQKLIDMSNSHFINFILEYKTRLPDKFAIIKDRLAKFDEQLITKDYADFAEKYSVGTIKNLYKTFKNYEKSYIQLYSFISAIDTSAVDLVEDDIVISHESIKKLLTVIDIPDFIN